MGENLKDNKVFLSSEDILEENIRSTEKRLNRVKNGLHKIKCENFLSTIKTFISQYENRIKGYKDTLDTIRNIKESLYEDKTVAERSEAGRGYVDYYTHSRGIPLFFKVPVEEAERFKEEELAYLLTKWMFVPEFD